MFLKREQRRSTNGSVRAVPLLPLRDIVVFPHMAIPLFVGREKSITALDTAMQQGKKIFLSAQRRAKTRDPTTEDIFEVGTLSVIAQMLRLPDGTVKVLVEGRQRARIKRFVQSDPCFTVELELLEVPKADTVEVEALVRSTKAAFETYVKLNKRIPPDMLLTVAGIDDPSRLADVLVAHLNLKLPEKQEILETLEAGGRLERLLGFLQAEIEILQMERKIRTRVKKQMERSQKEYYLNEQMQAIQKELGEKDEFRNELQELEAKLAEKKLSEEAEQRVKKELRKLRMMSPMSAEATVVRNYIDWILSLPWNDLAEEKLDIEEAQRILDEDHYGLTKVKERIIEYLSVRALVAKMKGPILCFVGPPGVGKTSLARSVARATGRPFVRLSLGGVRDEAEIRGHRRTYIGALPGKIIQSLKKATSNNPVFLMDEVDKMSTDFRGDPSSALLEVLDPEQNHTFNDHYLDLDYDLSNVMFITTANTLHGIPSPLQDRMEIIRIPGYAEWEKLAIARRYLIPKERAANGVTEDNLRFTTGSVMTIIRRYTREAGVRNLQREIAAICRKVARKVVEQGPDTRVTVTASRVSSFLGVPRYRYGRLEARNEIGFVNGLAWTQVGGELVPVEATVLPGKGKLILTGQLGSVMQESAQAALSYIRSRTEAFGLDRDFYQKVDLHVHVPEIGPVDGPSAGITMCLSLVSALLRVPVFNDVAMTGEITLRGKVRPIGGLKEKLLAAHRGGIRRVVFPKENEKDLKEVPARIKSSLVLTPADHMDDVLRVALDLKDPEPFFARLAASEKDNLSFILAGESVAGERSDQVVDSAEKPQEETSVGP